MKRKTVEKAGSTALMLFLSIVCASVVIAIASDTPWYSIKVFFTEPFADWYTICRILTESIPLMFTGAAVCLMASAGQFNMFVEGGFFLGAFVAAVLSPEIANGSVLMPLLCVLAGAVAAGVAGYGPAKLKAKLGIDEFVTSLMLNYIVLWVVLYLVNNVLGDPDMANVTKYLEDEAKLPFLNYDNELSSGFAIAIAAALLTGLFLFRTKWGFSFRMAGKNREFASYCGVNTSKTVVASQVIGSSLAGLGGGVYLLGNYYRFSWRSLPNYGFDGFVIAIMAGNNPYFVPLASLFLAYIRVGARQMSLYTDVQNEIIYIIQGLIIIIFGAKALADRRRRKAC